MRSNVCQTVTNTEQKGCSQTNQTDQVTPNEPKFYFSNVLYLCSGILGTENLGYSDHGSE